MESPTTPGWRRIAAVSALLIGVLASACKGQRPTNPTAMTTSTTSIAPTVSVQSLRVTPSGAGWIYNTEFQFEAIGMFSAGAQFVWQFGDGSTAMTSNPTSTHTYSQTGNFGVTVEARVGSSSSAATVQLLVRSLVGRWLGTVSGHTTVTPSRPIPITRFDLTISSAPRPTSPTGSVTLTALWSDDAGCRRDRGIVQSFRPAATTAVSLSIESLPCNDGFIVGGALLGSDFTLRGTADASLNRVDGTCGGGPNCRFAMTRQ